MQDGTLTGCLGRYGFPLDLNDCARCHDNEQCKHTTHLKQGHRIKWLSRTTVTIIMGGYAHGRDCSTVVTLPIQKQLFNRLLGYSGTAQQNLVFLIDSQGTAIDFKTITEWHKAIDAQQ